MFDFFRKYNKIMMVLLFLLIIPSFVLFGVERYFHGNRQGEAVARVDGRDITRIEWDAQHRVEVDRIRQQMPNIDVSLLDSDAMRYSTLERLVREQVLAAAAAKDRMTVTDEHLLRLFAEDPALASFRGPDGKFNRELFMRITNRTPEQYQASVRSQLATQQVLAGVAESAFSSRTQTDAVLGPFYESREIQVALFEPAQFTSKVNVSDADIQAHYKTHSAQFQAPEQVDIEYVVLDLDAAKKAVVVNEADLKSYYEQNSSHYGSKEERRGSHILISAPAQMSAAEREKAKAKAQELLAQVRKSPDHFAEIARQNSQDPGSASKGGDLDYVARGAMVKPFDDALFALNKGDISDVIETEYGYHIIRLNDIRPAVVPPYEKVRPQIEAELRAQQAQQVFAKTAEVLSDIVYQQPDSLKPVAAKLNLPIQIATGVGRAPASDASGVLANRNFLSALYAPDALERKHNTEAIEIGPNQLAAGRVTRYSPARTIPFEEVKDKVRTLLVAEQAAELARKDGQAKLAAWQADGQDAAIGKPIVVSRQAPQSQPLTVVEAALRINGAKLPGWTGVDLGLQGYAVVRANKSIPREAPAADAALKESQDFAQAVGLAEQTAYYQLLKDRYKAQILVPKPTQDLLSLAR